MTYLKAIARRDKAYGLALLIACTLFALPTLAQAKEWHGITPLRSTRTDVERILGVPSDPDKEHISLYKLKDENVSIIYASGQPCGNDAVSMWRVPRGTVVEITIYPKVKSRIDTLQIDRSKYKVTDTGGHLAGVFYYTNIEEGIQYEVMQGEITGVSYFPSSSYNHLRCSNNSAELPPLFDSYGLTPEGVKLLDSFMLGLKRKPDMKGWIMIDLERQRAGELSFADRVISYLKKKYHKDFERIAITESYRLSREMELFIMPHGGNPTPFTDSACDSIP